MERPTSECRWMMRLAGLIPGWQSRRFEVAVKVGGHLLSLCGLFVFSVMKIITTSGDILQLTEAALATTVTLHMIPMFVNMFAKRGSMEEVLGQLDEIYSTAEPWQKLILDENAGNSNRFVKCFLGLPLILVIIGSFLLRLFELVWTGSYEIPFHLWVPWDEDAAHFVPICLSTYAFVSSCTVALVAQYWFIVFFMCQISGLMRILEIQFRNVATGADHKLLRDDEIRYRLKICVIFHNRIIQLVSTMNEIFSAMLFMEYILSSLQCCFGGYLCTKLNWNKLGSTSPVAQFVSTLVMPFIICWFGSKIKSESLATMGALYDSGWENCSPSIRREILILLTASDKPLVLHFKKIFVFEIQQYANMLQASYSYFTLVWSLD